MCICTALVVPSLGLSQKDNSHFYICLRPEGLSPCKFSSPVVKPLKWMVKKILMRLNCRWELHCCKGKSPSHCQWLSSWAFIPPFLTVIFINIRVGVLLPTHGCHTVWTPGGCWDKGMCTGLSADHSQHFFSKHSMNINSTYTTMERNYYAHYHFQAFERNRSRRRFLHFLPTSSLLSIHLFPI